MEERQIPAMKVEADGDSTRHQQRGRKRRRRRIQVTSNNNNNLDSTSFSFYDNLRSSIVESTDEDYDDDNDPDDTSPLLQNQHDEALIESQEDSSVLRVIPPSSSSARSNIMDKEDKAQESSYRLIHLPCVFGFSRRIRGERQVLTSLFASAKAALMAQHHFNNRIDTIVPDLASKYLTNRHTGQPCNIRMTLDFYDTSRSPRIGAAVVSKRIHPRHFPYQPTAIVGAVRSSVSLPMAILNSMRKVPQISYASTSNTLSNRESFPYFARTIPSNADQAQVAIDFFQTRLGTTHLGILYVEDEYGVDYQLALQQAAADRGIVTKSAAINWDASSSSNATSTVDSTTTNPRDSMQAAIDTLLASGYRHFMAIIFSHQLELLLEMGAPQGLLGPDRFWLLGDGISHRHVERLQYPSHTPMAQALQGLGILTTGGSGGGTLSNDDGSSSDVANGNHLERFIDQYHAFDAMEEFPAYFAAKTPLATDYVKFEQNYTFHEPNQFQPLVYDSIMGLGIAACQAEQDFFNGQDLLDEFMQVDFEGASGTVRMDPSTASRARDSMAYSVINSVITNPDRNGMVGVRTFVASEYHPDNYTTSDEGQGGATSASWDHHPQGFTFNFSDFSSIPPASLPAVQEEYNMISQASFVAGTVCACFFVASAIGFAVWTWWNRNSHVVRASQPGFLLAINLGCICIGLSAITLGADSPRQSHQWANFSCMATIWLFSVGFSLAFSALAAKTWRINKILGRENQFRRVVVRPKDVALPGIFIVLGNIGVVLGWQLYNPLSFVRTYDDSMSVDVYGRANESCGKCLGVGDSGKYFGLSLLAINGAAIVAANVQAYRARHITTEFSESRYIAIAMAIILQGLILALPLFFFEIAAYTSYVAKITLILLSDGSILFLMFIPKIMFWRKHLKQSKLRELEKAQRQSRRRTAHRLRFHPPKQEDDGNDKQVEQMVDHDIEMVDHDIEKDLRGCNGQVRRAGGDENDDEGMVRSFEDMLLGESGVQIVENRRLHADECYSSRPRSDLTSGVRVMSNNPCSMSRVDSSEARSEGSNRMSEPSSSSSGKVVDSTAGDAGETR